MDTNNTPNTQRQPPSKTTILIFSLAVYALFSLSRERVFLEKLAVYNGQPQEAHHAVVKDENLNFHNDDEEEEEIVIPATNATTQAPAVPPPVAVFDPNNLCSALTQTSRATRLWNDHLEEILQATKAMADDDLDTVKELLETTLTPARMRRAVTHLPTFSHAKLKHVVNILQRKWMDDQSPPLTIAVFGGSVTIGRNCVEGRMQIKECAWPYRLEQLVNQFFGKPLIKVYNLGIGGTNSKTATNRIKYWMYGDRTLNKIGPDIIVNSYSTNDSLPPWDKKWPEDDLITLTRNNIHTALEAFVRTALTSKPPCETAPLVIHVDDYLGPQQPALLGELAYVQEMTQLAKYYDTVGISYGEVVRDIAYQDHTETNFHNHKDVHYGPIAHTTIALSVAFASLELWINYCDDEETYKHENTTTNDSTTTLLTKEQMKEQKLFLPPPLTKELLQANATNEFEAALEDSYRAYIEHDCQSTNSTTITDDRNPCSIAWISTPGNWDASAIARFMKTYQTLNHGWESERQNAEGWSNKDGWIAKEPNATFALEFEATTKSIKTVSVYFLRSYGDKWKDSIARFTISNSATNAILAQHEIAGVHAAEDYHYSLTLSETIVLSEPVAIGEKLTMKVDLVSGGHFKIMGLMLCNK